MLLYSNRAVSVDSATLDAFFLYLQKEVLSLTEPIRTFPNVYKTNIQK